MTILKATMFSILLVATAMALGCVPAESQKSKEAKADKAETASAMSLVSCTPEQKVLVHEQVVACVGGDGSSDKVSYCLKGGRDQMILNKCTDSEQTSSSFDLD